jgi:hypothetical protein
MTVIAGHQFANTPNGRRCMSHQSDGSGVCYRAWVDIRNATEADLGATGIAHVGKLNDAELREIITEREREEAALWDAVSAVSAI